jgi:RNA polymerase-binding transcription factor DksA
MTYDIYQARLEEEKAALERELAALGKKNNAVPDDYEFVVPPKDTEPDSLDEAAAHTDESTAQSIFTDLEARYDSVLAALTRIQDGTYGRCAVGGEPIPPARLDANPAAATCVAHET